MLRRIFTLILCLSLVMLPGPIGSSAAQADSGDFYERVAMRAFLIDLRERVRSFIALNMADVIRWHKCSLGQNDGYINCAQELDHMTNEIRINYPIMRKYRMLMKILSPPATDELFFALERHLNAVQRGVRGQNLIKESAFYAQEFFGDSPLSSVWNISGIVDSDYRPDEFQHLLSDTTIWDDTIQRPENLNEYFQYFCQKTFSPFADSCLTLSLKYSDEFNALYFESSTNQRSWGRLTPSDIRYNLIVKPGWPTAEPAEKMSDKFMALAHRRPYLALVPSAQPNRQELSNALKHMAMGNMKVAERFNKEFPIDSFENLSHEAVLEKLIPLMGYAPAVKSVLELPGPTMSAVNFNYDAVKQVLEGEHFFSEFKSMGKEILYTVVGTIVSCLFIKKLAMAFKVVQTGLVFKRFNARDVIMPTCMGVGSLGVNLWFIYEAYAKYQRTFQELFSATDDQKYLRELDSLKWEQRFAVLAVIMAPLGTGIGSGAAVGANAIRNYLQTYGVKISPQFMQRILRSKGA